MECGKLLYGKRFLLKQKGAVYKSCVWPTVLNLFIVPEIKHDGNFMKDSSMVRAMCGVQLRDRKPTKNSMHWLAFNETINQLVIANSVHWYGHLLWKESGNILRRALDFWIEGQW